MSFAWLTDSSAKSVGHAKIFDLTLPMIAQKGWSKNALNVTIY